MEIKNDIKPNDSKKMFMTFENYVRYPYAKGASPLTAELREMIYERYKKKLDVVIVREMNKFDYFLYYDKMSDIYVCHLKVPSEVVPKLRYDVVIQFFTDNDNIRKDSTLNRYYVKFFSNDPAYNFEFCHTHIEHGLYIQELHSKSMQKAIKEKANIKNPKDELGYIKSLMFAYFIMKNKSLFSKALYQTTGSPYNPKVLLTKIMSSDDKLIQRTELGQDIERVKKLSKKGMDAAKSDHSDDAKFIAHSNKIKRTKTVNTVKKIGTTKRTNKKK